jgi:uncharacterized damage-inducible protein DinB
VSAPEVWLRGALPDIAPILQPAAHALMQVREELERLLPTLSADEAWVAPGGAASVGYHARHLAAATDRLLTYARGEPLSEAQRVRLASEKEVPEPPPDGAALLDEVTRALDDAVQQLRGWSTRPGTLLAAREVGRSRLPSTVLGLLFHVAEHAQRHAGQVATTVKVVRAMRAPASST